MREFIKDGIINGDFTDEEKIKLTTNYLSKDTINQDDVLFILKSIYPSTFTEEGEEVEHEGLAGVLEEVIANAETAMQENDLHQINTVLKTTSMSLSELIMQLYMGGKL
ncbi:hypothetical protein ACF3NG_06735 [Aerococcaceae bacterium WGS1372]